MSEDKCQIKNCNNVAKYIGSLPESGIINMCGDCYHRLYRS